MLPNPMPGLPPGMADATATIAVLVVEDQPAVREGLARLIVGATLAPRGVHTAANTAEALDAVARIRPDVVVLDVDLAGEDGLALMPCFAPGVQVLVLTSFGDAATRRRALQLGAGAFVGKEQPATVLIASLRTLAAVAAATQAKTRGEKAPAALGVEHPAAPCASSAAARQPRP